MQAPGRAGANDRFHRSPVAERASAMARRCACSLRRDVWVRPLPPWCHATHRDNSGATALQARAFVACPPLRTDPSLCRAASHPAVAGLCGGPFCVVAALSRGRQQANTLEGAPSRRRVNTGPAVSVKDEAIGRPAVRGGILARFCGAARREPVVDGTGVGRASRRGARFASAEAPVPIVLVDASADRGF
jgi:hypothetical protein